MKTDKQIVQERIEQLKNAIALVKETKATWFKENLGTGHSSGFIIFNDDGDEMWIEPVRYGKLNIPIGTDGGIYGITKKYVMEKLREELIELM